MKTNIIILFASFLLTAPVLYAQSLFQGYDAALVIYSRANGDVITIDTAHSARCLSPCSTFKIYDTLQDLTLREVFRVSAVPGYQILARKTGENRMKNILSNSHFI